MNKTSSILAITLALTIGVTAGSMQYGESFLHTNNNPTDTATPEIRAIGGISDDVWQESCNPIIILKDTASCQQLNVVIQQNSKIIGLLENNGFGE